MWLFGRPKMGQEGEIEEWKGEGEEVGGGGGEGGEGGWGGGEEKPQL